MWLRIQDSDMYCENKYFGRYLTKKKRKRKTETKPTAREYVPKLTT